VVKISRTIKQSTILKSKALTAGSTIGIISPASRPLDEEKYRNGILYLRDCGYQVVESNQVLDSYGYLAGSDQVRADNFNAMFRDPQIDAVFCSRGGYGTPRIIDAIDYDVIRKNPKLFVGYSDITALNLAIWKKASLVTFSGPMVAVEMGKGIQPFTEAWFWKLLTSPVQNVLLSNPPDSPVRIIRPGQASGRLLGGCLSLINAVLGSAYCPNFQESILFIEDIEEEPYRIDRYLAQLKLAGIFKQISGLVIGQFVDCVPSEPEKPHLTIDQIIEDFVRDLNIPIIANFAYGHVPIKHTMPIGIEVELNTGKGGLIMKENAVSFQDQA